MFKSLKWSSNLSNEIVTKYKKIQQQLILNQKNLPPLVYFLYYVIQQAYPHQADSYDSFSLILLMAALFLLLANDINILFVITPFKQISSLPLLVFSFIIGMIASNQSWKMQLFLFNTGNIASKIFNCNLEYMFLASTFICIYTYKQLIFKSFQENKQYFTGFFILAFYSFTKLIFKAQNQSINLYVLIAILFFVFNLGDKIMTYKICFILSMEMNHINNGRILTFYMQMIQKDKEAKSNTLYYKFKKHKNKCTLISCFCKLQPVQYAIACYIKELFQQQLMKISLSQNSVFIEEYFDFLLANQPLINILYSFNQFKICGKLSKISLIRINGKIERKLSQREFDNIYQIQHAHALKYDVLHLHFITQIYEACQNKMGFYEQIQKRNPKASIIYQTGTTSMQKVQNLNRLYCQIVQQSQKTLLSFEITLLFSIFLNSTTNFKAYAELLLKNARNFQQMNRTQKKCIKQTNAIRVYIYFDKKMANIEGENKSKQKLSFYSPKNSKYSHILVVDTISNGFLRMLKMQRDQVIGYSLSRIMPSGYTEVHNARISNLLDFQRTQFKKFVPTPILHNQLTLPIKGANDILLYSFLYIKILGDIEKGITFIAAVRSLEESSSKALIDFTGRITQKQTKFNSNILYHPQVRKCLERCKCLWDKDRVIPAQQFSIVMDQFYYKINISSPLIILFLDKYKQLQVTNPPIHIEAIMERGQFLYDKIMDQINLNKIKLIKKSTSDDLDTSQNITNVSSINNLLSFEKQNSVPKYRSIYLIFIIVMVIGLGMATVAHFFIHLQWDNTQTNFNPIADTISMLKIQMLTLKVLQEIGDLGEIQIRGDQLNSTLITQYLGSNNYQSSIISILNTIRSQLNHERLQYTKYPSSLLSAEINQRLNTPISTVYKGNPIAALVNTSVTLNELILNYIVDLDIIISTSNLSRILIVNTYNDQVVNLQNTASFNDIINDSISSSERVNLALCLSLSIINLLAIAFLVCALRARQQLHKNVYDILISLQQDMIQLQIAFLMNVVKIIKNWKDEDYLNKMNRSVYLKIQQRRQIHLNKQTSIRANFSQFLKDRRKTNDYQWEKIKQKRESIRNTRTSQRIFSSPIIKFSESKFLSQSHTSKYGKQLNWQNTEYDQNRIIKIKHACLYIFVASFILFFIIIFVISKNHFESLRQAKFNLINTIAEHNEESIIFVQGKLYLRHNVSQGYNINLSINTTFPTPIVNGTFISQYNFSVYASQIIQKVTKDLSIQSKPQYSLIEQSCRNYTHDNISFLYKYCSYNYSYNILLGEYRDLYKNLYQMRINADYNLINQQDLYQSIIIKISEKVFYLQSLFSELQSVLLSITDSMFQDLLNVQSLYKQKRYKIYLYSIVLGLTCLIAGCIVIQKMKRKYIKQACIVSLLNSQMLTKNKRIEPFILSLFKSGYQ